MVKNDIVRLSIESITGEGSGVGRYDGMVVFVPFSAVGDLLDVRIVKTGKSYCYGKIEQIITPSPDRVSPDCKVFGKCGGCAFRHISYEAELRAKEDIIRSAFTRIGGLDPEFLPIIQGSVSRWKGQGRQYRERILCRTFTPNRTVRQMPA